MKKAEYEKMYSLEDSHFWFVGKRYFINTYLNKINSNIHTILDIGSGTGGTTKFLEKFGKVTGVEKNPQAIAFAKKRGLRIFTGEVEKLPFKKNEFDLITMFDVLYHKNVKDVGKAILEIGRVTKSNGYLLITDSALNILSGQHSLSVAEARRFTLKELESILLKKSFRVISSSYVYFFLLPVIFLKRFILDKLIQSRTSDVSAVPQIINILLISLLKFESLLLHRINFPVGSSLIILAKKNTNLK